MVQEEVSNEPAGGLALYTVRDAMGEDPKGTLQQVAAVGYANIEAAGYNEGTFYGMPPTEFKSYLDSIGLNPVSTHQGSVTLENADAMIADVKAAGFKYFVVPVPPMGMFKFDPATRKLSMEGTAEQLAEILETLGQKCKDSGLELLYHNHDFELIENEDGVVVLDYLLENLDPELVNFQMDLYWVTAAGADPLAYFEAHPRPLQSLARQGYGRSGKICPGWRRLHRLWTYPGSKEPGRYGVLLRRTGHDFRWPGASGSH